MPDPPLHRPLLGVHQTSLLPSLSQMSKQKKENTSPSSQDTQHFARLCLPSCALQQSLRWARWAMLSTLVCNTLHSLIEATDCGRRKLATQAGGKQIAE